MAKDYFLDSHYVKVRPKKSNNYQLLGSCGDANVDLFYVVSSFLNSMDKNQNNEEKGVLIVKEDTHFEDNKNESIYGFIRYGNYGSPFEVIDNESWERNSYGKQNASVRNFFFMFYLPKHADTGLLILLRIGAQGIQGHIVPDLRKFFSSTVEDCILEFSPVHYNLTAKTPAELKGIEVTLFEKRSADDVAATKNISPIKRSRKALSVVLPLTGQDRLLNKLLRSTKAKQLAIDEVNPICSIDWDNYDTQVKAEVKLNGRSKMVKVTREFSYNTLTEITDDLKLDDDGYPTIDSLLEAAHMQIHTIRTNGAL